MSGRRRIVTTIETHEVLVLRRAALVTLPQPCASCVEAGVMLTPQEAARRAGVSQRTIYRWVEDGLVHFAETTDGSLFVCLAPLDADVG